jgi:hypothetical protein
MDEIRTNRVAETGKKVYNENDPLGDIFLDTFNHAKSLAPGDLRTLGKLWDAATGQPDKSGLVPKAGEVIQNVFTGTKVLNMDVDRSFSFKLWDIKNQRDAAWQSYTSATSTRENISNAEIKRRYDNYVSRMQDLRKQMLDLEKAAMHLGLNAKDVQNAYSETKIPMDLRNNKPIKTYVTKRQETIPGRKEQIEETLAEDIRQKGSGRSGRTQSRRGRYP